MRADSQGDQLLLLPYVQGVFGETVSERANRATGADRVGQSGDPFECGGDCRNHDCVWHESYLGFVHVFSSLDVVLIALVVKTRMQLSARNTRHAPISSPVPPATSAGSPLPRPIAASAAALASAAATASPVPSATATFARPSAVAVAMSILRTEGIRGLYRGLSASYLGVSEGVIQWVLYERFKRLSSPTSEPRSGLSFVTSILGASSGAKAVASLITYPHEVVRTRLRQPGNKYTGLVQTLRLVVREEGARALYGGLTAHMFRVVPNAACMFLIYEVVADKLGS